MISNKKFLLHCILFKIIYSAQVYKQFNTNPLELSPGNLALTINLSKINATHQPYVLTRQPASQEISEASIEAIVNERKKAPQMVFTDQISLSFWTKIPDSFSFKEEVPFLQLYFPNILVETQFKFYNKNLFSQKNLESVSFSKINLSVDHGKWIFLSIDYHFTSQTNILQVKVNDIDKAIIYENSSLFQNGSLKNVLLSIGTADFIHPLVNW